MFYLVPVRLVRYNTGLIIKIMMVLRIQNNNILEKNFIFLA